MKKCKVEGCDGILQATGVLVQVGCSSYNTAYPCEKCHRLHLNGEPASNRQGNDAYYEDGKIVLKDTEGKIVG